VNVHLRGVQRAFDQILHGFPKRTNKFCASAQAFFGSCPGNEKLPFEEKSFNRQELKHSRTQELKNPRTQEEPKVSRRGPHRSILAFLSTRVLEFWSSFILKSF